MIPKNGCRMQKIESRTGHLAHDDQKVFDFISDFTHFNSFIPADKVTGWEADTDSCKFTVAGIGMAGMKIIQREPSTLIKIVSDEKTPIRFTMWIQLKNIAPGSTKVKLTIEPDVNKAIMYMVEKPLKEFINSLVDRMEKFDFS